MKTRLMVVAAAAAVGFAVADAVYRTREWGAFPQEVAMDLPGDGLVPEPAITVTRGVTVRAPADEVWRWVQEIGRVRGGVALGSGRSVVLLGAEPEAPGGPGRAVPLAPRPLDAVTSLHVLPMETADGRVVPDRCRLVARSRSQQGGPATRLVTGVLEPVELIVTRRLLLGVKERAERSALQAAVAAH
jgi:hypothetical protein